MRNHDCLELLFLRAQCQTAEATLELIAEKLSEKLPLEEKLLFIETLVAHGCTILSAEKLIHKRRLKVEAEIIDIRPIS